MRSKKETDRWIGDTNLRWLMCMHCACQTSAARAHFAMTRRDIKSLNSLESRRTMTCAGTASKKKKRDDAALSPCPWMPWITSWTSVCDIDDRNGHFAWLAGKEEEEELRGQRLCENKQEEDKLIDVDQWSDKQTKNKCCWNHCTLLLLEHTTWNNCERLGSCVDKSGSVKEERTSIDFLCDGGCQDCTIWWSSLSLSDVSRYLIGLFLFVYAWQKLEMTSKDKQPVRLFSTIRQDWEQIGFWVPSFFNMFNK